MDRLHRERLATPWLGSKHFADLTNRDLRAIAAAIVQMSDYYKTNPTHTTPWSAGEWVKTAQLYYYLPLNVVRLKRVLRELKALGFFDDIDAITDFGAGLGAVAWALADLQIPLQRATALEKHSQICQALVGDLPQPWVWTNEERNCKSKHWVFSFSATELDRLPTFLKDQTSVILLEPSLEKDARRLMSWRSQLQEWGYHIWAPCVNGHLPCPLLREPRDWCHHRIAVDLPDWFVELSEHLPMHNHTVTYSFLAAHKRVPAMANRVWPARVLGDLLQEKGKDRQMVCSSTGRQFLSWLHREHPQPDKRGVRRGDVIDLATLNILDRGKELRVSPES